MVGNGISEPSTVVQMFQSFLCCFSLKWYFQPTGQVLLPIVADQGQPIYNKATLPSVVPERLFGCQKLFFPTRVPEIVGLDLFGNGICMWISISTKCCGFSELQGLSSCHFSGGSNSWSCNFCVQERGPERDWHGIKDDWWLVRTDDDCG